jgi:methylglutaconyl-CoA hydratase
VEGVILNLLKAAPVAQQETKNLLNRLSIPAIDENVVEHTASLIAGTRLSAEAREGMNSFLEKRTPNWNHN